MSGAILRPAGRAILYDPVLLQAPGAELFDPARWAEAPTAPGYSGGRGATRFIRYGDGDWVLRHYHRGGTVGRFLEDAFLWPGEERTRCFREWRLLAELTRLALPVPAPVAAHYRRRGLLYSQDLITVRIPDVEPLSTRLARGPAPREVWQRVGACIASFHRADVWHADLTAHNLQIDPAGRIFLLDFDRGRFRAGAGRWREQNLARLQRSLRKISQAGGAAYSAREWDWLLEGYR